MRLLDEQMVGYSGLDPALRRFVLCAVDDAPAACDLAPRLEFACEAVDGEEGVVRSQALVTFVSLLGRARTEGWMSSYGPPMPVPIVGQGDVAFGEDRPPLTRLALSLAADEDLLRSIESALPDSPDPLPLAIGFLRREDANLRLLSLVRDRFATDPGLALVLTWLTGEPVGATFEQLAQGADAAGAVSLFRALPGHPELAWNVPFAKLADGSSGRWRLVHAIVSARRIASPHALAALEALAESAEDALVRVEAAKALASVAPARAVDLALQVLQGPDEAARADVLTMVLERELCDERLLPALERARGDHPRLVASALALAARAGANEAHEELVALAGSEDEPRASAAVHALASLGEKRDVAVLEGVAMSHPAIWPALVALRALSRTRGFLNPTVFAAALGRGGAVARTAAEALLVRAASEPGEVLRAVASVAAPGPALLAVGLAAAVTGSREGLGLLGTAIDSGVGDTARWATEALYPLGQAIPMDLLEPALKSRLASVRARAAVALVLAGDRRGLRILRRMLTSPGVTPRVIRAFLDLAALRPHLGNWPLFAECSRLFIRDHPGGSSRITRRCEVLRIEPPASPGAPPGPPSDVPPGAGS